MATLLIANNCTVESGSFAGDQLCSLKTAYLFVEHTPDIDRILMSMSPQNSLGFLWQKFIDTHKVEVIWDNWNPGDWEARWGWWNKWRAERIIEGIHFDVFKELYLRIHGSQRQTLLCGSERGLGRRNIYSYWWCGQEGSPEELPPEVDWFDDSLIYHPEHTPIRDVYISPLAKTQGNVTFTFEFWSLVVHKLVDAGVTVTVGYNGWFCEDLNDHPCYRKVFGTHEQWMQELCNHKLVSCGNTGTGWLAAACGIPLLTMEPVFSQMPDHRYRQCGLRNIVEVVDTPDPDYVARRIIEYVQQCVVLTTGCYDILHAGHVRHLERARSLGTRLVVALNSDESVRSLKGPTRPINPCSQRRAILESLRCVDEVRVFDGPHALHIIEQVKPAVLACGYGYTPDKVVGRKLVESWGGRVVITCPEDAKDQPSTTKIVQRAGIIKPSMSLPSIIEICRLGAAYSVNPPEKLKLMADEFLKVADLPGDVADLGAYRGGTSLILRRLRPDKHLHVFDTWEGTPYDDSLCHHKRGSWIADVHGCRQLVGVENAWYYVGVFPDVLSKTEYDKDYHSLSQKMETAKFATFCFVYVDMDTEQATRDAIEFFWSRMVTGGIMFFDDYAWPACGGVKKAIDETFDTLSAGTKRVVQSLYTCILEKL